MNNEVELDVMSAPDPAGRPPRLFAAQRRSSLSSRTKVFWRSILRRALHIY